MTPQEVRIISTLKDLKIEAKKLGIVSLHKFKKSDIDQLRTLIIHKLKPTNVSVVCNKKNNNVVESSNNKNKKRPKFVNISDFVDPHFEARGFANKNRYNSFLNNNSAWLQVRQERKIQNGDIVFTGHPYETRQEYGFAIVKNNMLHSGSDELYNGGAHEGINSLTKKFGFTNYNYVDAKKNISEFGKNFYMFQF
jgi:hypothetical protein